MHFRSLVIVASLNIPFAALACPQSDGPVGSEADLTVLSTSFTVSDEDQRRMVTTLGRLKNASSDCLEEIFLEVKFLDATGGVIDTVTQPAYGLVVPAKGEASFRVRDTASQPKSAYVSQSVRVLAAEARRKPVPKTQSSPLVEFLVAWGPMLLLIGVWIFFMQRMKRKDSPQGRSLALIEQQNSILEAQNALLARIAAATEARSTRGGAVSDA